MRARPCRLSAPIPAPRWRCSRRSARGASRAAGRSAARATAVDGKGRPLNVAGEKAPLVHLDGSLYQEPTPSAPTPAPPAYEI